MIGTNLAFDSNCKMGAMGAFVLDFQKTHAKDRLFSWPAEPQRSIIDTAVYSKRRLMRTPLSSKLNDETKTPLKLLQPWDCINWIEDAFITNLEACAPDLLILSMEDISGVIPVEPAGSFHPVACVRNADRASARYDQSGRGSSMQATVLALPADVIQQLQALMDAAGSKGCRVLDKPPIPGKNDGTPNFQCENVEKRRECLVCQGEVHKDNNAFLNVRSDGRVHYWCHAPSCNREGSKYIGDLKPSIEGTVSSSPPPGAAAAGVWILTLKWSPCRYQSMMMTSFQIPHHKHHLRAAAPPHILPFVACMVLLSASLRGWAQLKTRLRRAKYLCMLQKLLVEDIQKKVCLPCKLLPLSGSIAPATFCYKQHAEGT